MNTHDIAIELLDAARKRGGATIDPTTGEYATEGYAVGVPIGVGFSFRDFGSDFIDMETIVEFIDEVREKGYLVGSWKNLDSVYLDAIQIFHDREEAIQAGMAAGEIAIYHLGTTEEIFLR